MKTAQVTESGSQLTKHENFIERVANTKRKITERNVIGNEIDVWMLTHDSNVCQTLIFREENVIARLDKWLTSGVKSAFSTALCIAR